jgi:hypothetical protein
MEEALDEKGVAHDPIVQHGKGAEPSTEPKHAHRTALPAANIHVYTNTLSERILQLFMISMLSIGTQVRLARTGDPLSLLLGLEAGSGFVARDCSDSLATFGGFDGRIGVSV